MNSEGSNLSGLPMEVVIQIDRLADEFEAQLLSGTQPAVEDYLARLSSTDAAARDALNEMLTNLVRDLRSSPTNTGATPPAHGESTVSSTPAAFRPLVLSGGDEPIVIGEYQLLDQLGAGGMGVVYRASHLKLDRTVALKFPSLGAAVDHKIIARFLREAKLIGNLRHPHIVQALDASDSPYGPFLVTEYIEGETLGELVERRGALPFDQCLKLAIQSADAFQYAHNQGVVHRDIKPSNLLIDQQGDIQVVDFGLAKRDSDLDDESTDAKSVDRTESGVFLGTVGYAAPEQLFAESVVDERADIYSLGCVIHFMLTGKPPHAGTLSERLLAGRGSKSGKLKLPSSDGSTAFRKIWARITAEDPAKRYDSMALVKSALETELFEWQQTHRDTAGVSSIKQYAIATGVLLLGAWGLLQWGNQNSAPARTGELPPRAVIPFSAEQAQEHQQLWADGLGQPVRVENSVGVRLVLIPAGEFQMGTDNLRVPEDIPEDDWRYVDPEELRIQHQPAHKVVLSHAYYFSETEVTVAQFQKFVDATGYTTDAERDGGWGKEDKGWLKRKGYSWKNMGQWLSDARHPVINVSWNDAVAFCEWLNQVDDLGTYRPPSEAEWEFACRAGTDTLYYFGDQTDDFGDYACYKGNFEVGCDLVGLRNPNAFGLYDVYGNRQEWCLDAYEADYYSKAPLSDPVCRSAVDLRVLRGGTHTDPASFCTSVRRWNQSRDSVGAAGIRVVCVPK